MESFVEKETVSAREMCAIPAVATCFPGYNSSSDVLCGKGLYACGSVSSNLFVFLDAFCYDANNYYCLNLVTGPVIIQNSQANLYCGATVTHLLMLAALEE
jgi:hypothetical protein